MGERRRAQFEPESFFSKIRGGAAHVAFRKDQLLYAQGDQADSLFYLREGKVKVTVLSTEGKEAIIGLLEAGDFCGEGCLAGQVVRMASVAAMTDCSVARIDKRAMIRFMHEQPAVSEMLVTYLLARNARIEADLIDQLFNSSEKRLARLLLLLSNFAKEGKPEAIVPTIPQATLAEMIGATRASVSHFMNKFRRLGFIDYNGHVEVHSSLLTVVLSDSSGVYDPAGGDHTPT